MAIFEMSDGIVFNYRGSWCAQGMPTAWACDWRAIGTKGTALWDGEEEMAGEVVAGDEGLLLRPTRQLIEAPPAPLASTGHAGVIDDFVMSAARAAEHRRPSAPTTSRAWPWSTPRSRARKAAVKWTCVGEPRGRYWNCEKSGLRRSMNA